MVRNGKDSHRGMDDQPISYVLSFDSTMAHWISKQFWFKVSCCTDLLLAQSHLNLIDFVGGFFFELITRELILSVVQWHDDFCQRATSNAMFSRYHPMIDPLITSIVNLLPLSQVAPQEQVKRPSPHLIYIYNTYIHRFQTYRAIL